MRSLRTAAALGAVLVSALVLPAAALADADLAVTATDSPDPVAAGSNLTYTLTLGNTGLDPASAVTLAATLPAATTFVSLSAPGGWSCTTPPVGAGGTINCGIGSLPSAGSASFTLVVETDPGLAAGTVLSLTASATTTTPEADPANDSATATTTVADSADLFVSLTGSPSPAAVGENVTYALSLGNAGPSSAAGASVSVPLPGGMAFQSLDQPGGFTCSTPAAGATTGAVTCTMASLSLGTYGFALVLRPTAAVAGSTVTVTATATSSTADPDPGNASASAPIAVSAAPPPPPPPPAFRRPTVTGVQPGTGTAGTHVRITGDAFGGPSEVLFGGIPAPFVVDGHERISAAVPAGMPGRTVEVVVIGPGGSSVASPAARFTYDAVTPPPPVPPARGEVCAGVPDLAGRTMQGARRALARACPGPRVTRRPGTRGGKRRVVAHQMPAAGAALHAGETVVVRLRRP